MQIKKKTQLKIELDQNDIVEAVRDFLLKHGQRISDSELAEINFVKSPKDGLRASLNVTEETVSDADEGEVESAPVATEAASVEPEPEPVAEPEPEPVQPEPEQEEAEPEPGEVETSTVEDVMPSIDEIAASQATVDAEEEEGLVPTAPAATTERKSLFL